MTIAARINLVTLGVADLAASTAFYERLGFRRSQTAAAKRSPSSPSPISSWRYIRAPCWPRMRACPTRREPAKFEVSRPDWRLFTTVAGLGQKAGVPLNRLRRLAIKEIADNALDAGGKIEINSRAGGKRFGRNGISLADFAAKDGSRQKKRIFEAGLQTG